MRLLTFAAMAALAACASEPPAPETELSAFPVERGLAPLPPSGAGGGHAPPPEGRAPGGLDFGQWRQADPAQYAPAFQGQVRARYAARGEADIRADLEANGFACEDSGRLDCRIEIMERECAFDWYVVVDRGRDEPIAGFDVMCLGGR